MDRSYLIQRLKKPMMLSKNPLFRDNPFAFGGGLANGGLSKHAMDFLRPIFSFDYMGSSEFEWGAVPKALTKIAQTRSEYAASEVEIPLRIVPEPRAFGKKPGRPKKPEGSVKVYVFCRSIDREEIHARIRGWAGEEYNDGLKEPTQIARVLRPADQWDGDVLGWLELNNGFFFFVDRVMWEKTVALFTAADQAATDGV